MKTCFPACALTDSIDGGRFCKRCSPPDPYVAGLLAERDKLRRELTELQTILINGLNDAIAHLSDDKGKPKTPRFSLVNRGGRIMTLSSKDLHGAILEANGIIERDSFARGLTWVHDSLECEDYTVLTDDI